MGRLFAVFLLLFQPIWAFAQCQGSDLINSLPLPDQALLEQRAKATAFGNGLFWHATKGDSEITLFGTYHFPHTRTEAHLEMLKPHIDRADVVFLEVSNADQAQLQREIALDPSIMFITEGDTLPDLLGGDDWEKLVEAMGERAIPGFMAAKFKPFWAAMMLGIGPCEARNGMMENKGIDARVGEYAKSIGNDSRSLEDYRTLLTLFDSFPQEDQLDMIRLFFAWSGDADDLAYTLRQRYLAQQIAMVWEFSRLISVQQGGADAAADFDLFEQQLLTRRNAGWIEVLLREAPGKKLLVAAGAAHLPGEVGVLRLLENQGYKITRLDVDP